MFTLEFVELNVPKCEEKCERSHLQGWFKVWTFTPEWDSLKWAHSWRQLGGSWNLSQMLLTSWEGVCNPLHINMKGLNRLNSFLNIKQSKQQPLLLNRWGTQPRYGDPVICYHHQIWESPDQAFPPDLGTGLIHFRVPAVYLNLIWNNPIEISRAVS